MMFGGQSNQLLAMYNLLYMGKELGRTVILCVPSLSSSFSLDCPTHDSLACSPPFTAIHFEGQQRPFNQIYDLPRFFSETGVSAIPLGFFKSPALLDTSKKDSVTCWSTMEIYTGAVNNHQVESGFNAHGVYTDFWAVPRIPRSSEGAVIEFRPLLDFLSNRTSQLEWVEETRRDFLPQKSIPKDVDVASVDRASNLKPFFDPVNWTPPTEDQQLTCVDATFYVGQCVFLFPLNSPPHSLDSPFSHVPQLRPFSSVPSTHPSRALARSSVEGCWAAPSFYPGSCGTRRRLPSANLWRFEGRGRSAFHLRSHVRYSLLVSFSHSVQTEDNKADSFLETADEATSRTSTATPLPLSLPTSPPSHPSVAPSKNASTRPSRPPNERENRR